MSQLLVAPKGFFFGSIIFHEDFFSQDDLIKIWTDRFGSGSLLVTDYNPSLPYYAKEMGAEEKLHRFIFCSNSLYDRQEIIPAKIWATEFEDQHLNELKRTVNIDIGLLNVENMILATGKNYSHRIYLGEGVFADLNYQYQNGGYQKLPWTYPDYLETEKLHFFKEMRANLLKLQKSL